MKLSVTGESPLSLVTQSECRWASRIAYELPTDDNPYGRHELFLSASSEDFTFAHELEIGGELLSGKAWSAMQQPEVCRGGRREPDTLGKFRPLELNRSEFGILVNAAYLVAIQPITAKPEDASFSRAGVEYARLFGAIMLQNDAARHFDTRHRSVFSSRWEDASSGYKRSAANAASLLLRFTRQEFEDAAPHSLFSPMPYGPRVTPAEEAMETYQAENPSIVEISRYKE